MLEKPNFSDAKIVACLKDEFGLSITQISFLPLGADRNTAVYRAVTEDRKAYFVKLRLADFEAVAVKLPKFLSDQGIRQIIAPLATRMGNLWVDLKPHKLILYNYVKSQNGYETNLSDQQWVDFGRTLKSIHNTPIIDQISKDIPNETYSPQGRNNVRSYLDYVEDTILEDPVALELAGFLKFKRAEILDLVERADQCVEILHRRQPDPVVCHSDLHAGNLLMDRSDNLFIVDWDNPIRAPKERDLMFIGGCQFGSARTPQEEENLFYQGYGQTQIDPVALAYYRYERIIQDISVYCDQLLLSSDGRDDREQSLRFLKSNFLPGNTIEIAYQSDRSFRF